MKELSLNILDVAENSVKAGASLTQILLTERGNVLVLEIVDDGCGMSEDVVRSVVDPFYTTRTTRKVGMGIPLFKMAAEMTGGTFDIRSDKGKGTTVEATFVLDSIDRAPLGDLADTVVTLLGDDKGTEFVFDIRVDGEKFVFDTRELKKELDGVSVTEPEVLLFVRDMINENIKSIGGEKL